jgi:hypothetical protein
MFDGEKETKLLWLGVPSPRALAVLIRTVLSGVVLSSAVLSCTTSAPEEQAPCPRRGPTFRLQITASEGDLPQNTALSVEYGGSNVERYSLRRGNGSNQSVCCRAAEVTSGELPAVPCAAPRDAGLPAVYGNTPPALLCELSTNGAARVEVVSDGYAVLEQTLQAQRLEDEEYEHCDALVTRDVALHLVRADAGAPSPPLFGRRGAALSGEAQ